MDFYNNIKPIYFYFASMVAFALSHIVRDQNISLYYICLLFGTIFFIFGFFKGRNKRK